MKAAFLPTVSTHATCKSGLQIANTTPGSPAPAQPQGAGDRFAPACAGAANRAGRHCPGRQAGRHRTLAQPAASAARRGGGGPAATAGGLELALCGAVPLPARAHACGPAHRGSDTPQRQARRNCERFGTSWPVPVPSACFRKPGATHSSSRPSSTTRRVSPTIKAVSPATGAAPAAKAHRAGNSSAASAGRSAAPARCCSRNRASAAAEAAPRTHSAGGCGQRLRRTPPARPRCRSACASDRSP